ncbi:MAG: GIDE domain-containing protein [Patescibacteria group bacterium]
MYFFGIVFIGLGGLMWYLGTRGKKNQARLAASKSVPVNQLQTGVQAEIQGAIVCDRPLQTPFSHRDCVYYSYEIEREVTERDSRGEMHTTWHTEDSNDEKTLFYVKDSSGKVAVNPAGAKIDAQSLGEQFLRPGEAFDNEIMTRFANKMGRFRTKASEEALLSGGPVYVNGYVASGAEGLVVQKGSGDFIISHRSEEEYEKSVGRSAMTLKVIGVILGIVGIIAIVMQAGK